MQRGGRRGREYKMSNIKVLTLGCFDWKARRYKKMIEKRNKKGTKN